MKTISFIQLSIALLWFIPPFAYCQTGNEIVSKLKTFSHGHATEKAYLHFANHTTPPVIRYTLRLM